MKKITIVVFALLSLGCSGDADLGDCDGGAEVCDVYFLVNGERDEVGLPNLTWSLELAVSAQAHAQDMSDSNYFDHNSLDGRNFSDRAKEVDYDGFPRGENIASGQQNAASVMDSWMSSVGHKRNILDNSISEIGVGHFAGLWVQVFGSRN